MKEDNIMNTIVDTLVKNYNQSIPGKSQEKAKKAILEANLSVQELAVVISGLLKHSSIKVDIIKIMLNKAKGFEDGALIAECSQRLVLNFDQYYYANRAIDIMLSDNIIFKHIAECCYWALLIRNCEYAEITEFQLDSYSESTFEDWLWLCNTDWIRSDKKFNSICY